MQFSNLFVTLLLSTVVSAAPKGNDKEVNAHNHKANGTHTDSVKQECNKIQQLSALVNLAANTTKLDKVTHSNATKEAAIQAKAAAAQTTLTTMESNSTLMSLCEVQYAAEKVNAQCSEMAKLTQMINTASNSTKLAKITHDNSTKAAEFTAKAAMAKTVLDTMTANTTLTAACSSIASDKEAKKEAKEAAKEGKAASATSSSSSSSSTSTSGSTNVVANTGIFSTIVLAAAGVLLL